MKNYNIYYMKPGTFRVLIHGDEQPQLAKLAETHVLLRSVQASVWRRSIFNLKVRSDRQTGRGAIADDCLPALNQLAIPKLPVDAGPKQGNNPKFLSTHTI